MSLLNGCCVNNVAIHSLVKFTSSEADLFQHYLHFGYQANNETLFTNFSAVARLLPALAPMI
ncbi:hypothetical protein AB669_03800 [Pedobacter sp. BMA]|nr:hypothetical protein AB669_03800 [Pedobacter sp. BMA]